jgi:hypothetical protein
LTTSLTHAPKSLQIKMAATGILDRLLRDLQVSKLSLCSTMYTHFLHGAKDAQSLGPPLVVLSDSCYCPRPGCITKVWEGGHKKLKAHISNSHRGWKQVRPTAQRQGKCTYSGPRMFNDARRSGHVQFSLKIYGGTPESYLHEAC